jgi:precorrin-6B methylase 1
VSLTLVGLGPSPALDDLTRRGEAALRACHELWLDVVTAGTGAERAQALQTLLGRRPRLARRFDRDERSELAARAGEVEVALAVAGDPLVATPHRHLLRELRARGVEVRVIPGVSALTAVATRAGLDAAAASVVVVEAPAAPTARELAAIAQALAQHRPVVVLAAGRDAEPSAEAWQALRARWPRGAELIALDGGGVSLLLEPDATC